MSEVQGFIRAENQYSGVAETASSRSLSALSDPCCFPVDSETDALHIISLLPIPDQTRGARCGSEPC
jgi:hypothetical protein